MTHRLVFIAVLLAFLRNASAQPIYVNANANSGTSDGSLANPFKNVTAAVAFAESSVNRNEIRIAAGTYVEASIIPAVNLIVVGADSSTTFLDCASLQPFFQLAANSEREISVANLTVKGCTAGAILARNGSTLILDHVTFRDNSHTSKGAGIILEGGTLKAKNSLFINNVGVAIATRNFKSFMEVNGSRFQNNTGPNVAATAGGITCDFNTDVKLNNCFFHTNRRAIYSVSGTLQVSGTKFYDNDAPSLSAVYCEGGVVPTETGNLFCGTGANIISCTGWAQPGLVKYDGCGVCKGNNENKDCAGTCYGTATNCTHQTYYVKLGANGVGTYSSPFNNVQDAIAACSSYGDTILVFPGVYATSNISFGGKTIHLKSLQSAPDETIFKCSGQSLFQMNSGESWDSVVEGITAQNCTNYAAFLISSASLTIRNCVVSNNVRARGSGLNLENSFSVIDDSQFIGNIASQDGSAILVTTSGAGEVSDVLVKNSRFFRNRAGQEGGAIHAGLSSSVEVVNSNFEANTGSQGGAIQSDSSTTNIKVTNCSFYSTNATTTNTINCIAGTTVTQSSNSFCGSDSSSTVTCTNWGTVTTSLNIDDCFACDGGNRTKDCNGTCWGFFENDGFGNCCHPKFFDCLGECSGDALEDETGTCCSADDKDCLGLCFGPNEEDGATPEPGCCVPQARDCAGRCSNTSREDVNGTCCLKTLIDTCNVCNGTCGSPPVTTATTENGDDAPILDEGSGSTGSDTGIYWLGFKLLYVLLVAAAILILLIILIVVIAVVVRKKRKNNAGGGGGKKVEMKQWY